MPNRKQPKSGMKRGYRYNRIVCPVCLKEIGENWYIRHINKYHANVPQEKINQLAKSTESARN